MLEGAMHLKRSFKSIKNFVFDALPISFTLGAIDLKLCFKCFKNFVFDRLPYIAYITFGYVKKAMIAFEGAMHCLTK